LPPGDNSMLPNDDDIVSLTDWAKEKYGEAVTNEAIQLSSVFCDQFGSLFADHHNAVHRRR